MICRLKDKFVVLECNEDNYKEILKKIGFDKNKCDETHSVDGRYSYVKNQKLYFGFKNSGGVIPFGYYVVFDYYFESSIGWKILSPKQFEEDFEVITEG